MEECPECECAELTEKEVDSIIKDISKLGVFTIPNVIEITCNKCGLKMYSDNEVQKQQDFIDKLSLDILGEKHFKN